MKDSILLRPLKEKDAPLMLEWLKDPDISHNFRFNIEEITIDTVLEFIRNSQNMEVTKNLAIVNETDEYLGTVSLKNIDSKAKSAEYAIALRKKAHGKRYGYWATVKILDEAFYTHGLERVYFNVLSDNINAVRFYEKFGFIYEGEFLNHIFVHNRIHSLKWFRLMKSEYERIMEMKI